MVFRFYNCGDAQAVDIYAGKAASEGGGSGFHTEFTGGVDVHGACGTGFCEGEVRVGDVAFGVGNPVGGYAGCEDDFTDAEFAGGFENVVGAQGVDAISFVVGEAHWLGDAWWVGLVLVRVCC